MSQPPEELEFNGDWPPFEDMLYQVFLDTVVSARLTFRGLPVKTQFRPETRGKGFSFWHVISEAESPTNRNEEDRIPDIERCRKLRWIAWLIVNAGQPGFSWWENQRGSETRAVIWAEEHDFAVILAKRRDKYVLKTAYCLKDRRRASFARERDEYWDRP
jgi:hypothetical protein